MLIAAKSIITISSFRVATKIKISSCGQVVNSRNLNITQGKPQENVLTKRRTRKNSQKNCSRNCHISQRHRVGEGEEQSKRSLIRLRIHIKESTASICWISLMILYKKWTLHSLMESISRHQKWKRSPICLIRRETGIKTPIYLWQEAVWAQTKSNSWVKLKAKNGNKVREILVGTGSDQMTKI